MKHTDTVRIGLIALICGFVGGAAAGTLMTAIPVAAQVQPAEVINAKQFRLVDEDGKILGIWTATPDEHGAAIMLFNKSGEMLWSAPPKARIMPAGPTP